MIRILVAAALTMAMSAPTWAQAGGVEQLIHDLEKQLRAAAVRADATWAERHFADDFTATTPLGVVRTKAEFIADHTSGAVKHAAEADDVRVRVYGDTAVVTARVVIKGAADGQDVSRQFRVTRVWVKQGGEWKVVAFQSTRIAEPTAGATAEP